MASSASSAVRGSPGNGVTDDEPSGRVTSVRTEGLKTGCKKRERSGEKLDG